MPNNIGTVPREDPSRRNKRQRVPVDAVPYQRPTMPDWNWAEFQAMDELLDEAETRRGNRTGRSAS